MASRLLALGVATCLLGGCGPGSPEEVREDYCSRVAEESAGLVETIDTGGTTSGLIDALPTLESLAKDAPDDIRDAYSTFLDAVRGLRDALDDAGLEPGDVPEGKLPQGLAKEDREALLAASVELASPDVRQAATSVGQHALDVCHTRLL